MATIPAATAMAPCPAAIVIFLASLVSLASAARPFASADISVRKELVRTANEQVGHRRWRPDAVNDQPLIGILSQPGTGDGPAPRFGGHIRAGRNDEDEVSYIAASYVKWVESAGGRPVPILYDDSDDVIESKFAAINGLIIPGGATELVPGPFMDAVSKLMKMALAANDAGDYFPVQGTCMGFEALTIYFSQNYSILQRDFKSEDDPSPLRFASANAHNRAYFAWMSKDLLEKLQTQNLSMENHEAGTTVERFLSSPGLSSFFDILTTSQDMEGKEYVSTIEAKHYPIYGTQWHPEKNAFEWRVDHIPHSADAVLVCQAAANFFVNEARRSSHAPKSQEELDSLLIYNSAPIFSGKQGEGYFEQSYTFNRVVRSMSKSL